MFHFLLKKILKCPIWSLHLTNHGPLSFWLWCYTISNEWTIPDCVLPMTMRCHCVSPIQVGVPMDRAPFSHQHSHSAELYCCFRLCYAQRSRLAHTAIRYKRCVLCYRSYLSYLVSWWLITGSIISLLFIFSTGCSLIIQETNNNNNPLDTHCTWYFTLQTK